MIENGPWIFPLLNAKGWKYNKQYGIVKIPTQTAGSNGGRAARRGDLEHR